MNNKTSGLGCGLLVIIAVVIGVGQFLFTTQVGWLIILVSAAAIWISVRTTKQKNREKLIAAFEANAVILNSISEGKGLEEIGGLSLNKGETAIYACQNVALTEYQSTGSSYSGTSGGVSFPLVGRIRGNVGMQGGQITKNPEQLMIVDQGRAVFTNQRIIFSGAKFVRDWDFDKIVDLAPGDNGFNVRIAVSNRERTSGLQALTPYEFGPGFPASYAFNLHSGGEASAKQWANELVAQLKSTAESLKAPKTK